MRYRLGVDVAGCGRVRMRALGERFWGRIVMCGGLGMGGGRVFVVVSMFEFVFEELGFGGGFLVRVFMVRGCVVVDCVLLLCRHGALVVSKTVHNFPLLAHNIRGGLSRYCHCSVCREVRFPHTRREAASHFPRKGKIIIAPTNLSKVDVSRHSRVPSIPLKQISQQTEEHRRLHSS